MPPFVKNWLLTFAVIATALTATWAFQTIRHHIHFYNGLNKGVALNAAGHCPGVEVWGEPGPFDNCD